MKTIQNMAKSMFFDGADDYIDCGADFIGSGDITFCGWIKPFGLGEGSAGRVIDNDKVGVFLGTSNTLKFTSNGSTNIISSSNQAIKMFKWNFFSITRASTGLVTMKINGSLSGNMYQNSGTPATGTTNVFLGNKSDGTTTFFGNLKNIQVFNRLLTEEEQDNIYENGVMPVDYSTSIVRDFDFEDSDTNIYSKNDINKRGVISGAVLRNDTPFANNVEIEKVGYGLIFATATDKVNMPNTTDQIYNGSDNLAMSFNFNLLGYPAGGYIFCYLGGTTNNRKYLVFSSGNLSYNAGNTTTTIVALSTLYNRNNNVFVEDDMANSRWRAFLNGVEVKSWTAYTKGTATSGVVIGLANVGTSATPYSVINSARIWSSPTLSFTDAEIKALYHNDEVPQTASLKVEYKLNEGTGTTALDTSGNGNNGIITGATYVKI